MKEVIKFNDINQILGNADIYLIDNILKGHFESCMNILDAGCGEGRNMRYFVKSQRMVVGMDNDPAAIKMARMTYRELLPESFVEADLSDIPLPDNVFDLCICSAVLHFAKSRKEFISMMNELIRVLKPGGMLFIRMATDHAAPIKDHPLFSYLLSHEDIDWLTQKFEWVEPFKTVVVEERSMAAMLLKKR